MFCYGELAIPQGSCLDPWMNRYQVIGSYILCSSDKEFYNLVQTQRKWSEKEEMSLTDLTGKLGNG